MLTPFPRFSRKILSTFGTGGCNCFNMGVKKGDENFTLISKFAHAFFILVLDWFGFFKQFVEVPMLDEVELRQSFDLNIGSRWFDQFKAALGFWWCCWLWRHHLLLLDWLIPLDWFLVFLVNSECSSSGRISSHSLSLRNNFCFLHSRTGALNSLLQVGFLLLAQPADFLRVEDLLANQSMNFDKGIQSSRSNILIPIGDLSG